jgi:hypothetical protein
MEGHRDLQVWKKAMQLVTDICVKRRRFHSQSFTA